MVKFHCTHSKQLCVDKNLIGKCHFKIQGSSGAARNFVREGPVTDVARFQTSAILHKAHFAVTGQFLVYYNRILRQIFYQSGSIN